MKNTFFDFSSKPDLKLLLDRSKGLLWGECLTGDAIGNWEFETLKLFKLIGGM